MFIDWLTVSQEYTYDLPVVCGVFTLTVDANTNEVLSTRQPRFKHEASFSTSVTIHVQGRKIRVEGNPSRVGRLDNLFGHQSIEQCISVYNALLRQYGLPELHPHFTVVSHGFAHTLVNPCALPSAQNRLL